jgi:uncharacterized protein (TIGR03435 family)
MRNFLLAALVLGQSAPAFDVTSVKVNTSGPDAPIRYQPMPGGRLTITNVSLRMVAGWAYGVQFFQLAGGPDWADVTRFDISAKASGNPTTAAMRVMLRALLTDRFRLAVHDESREMAVFALIVIRDAKAPQLKRSSVDCSATPSVGANACEFDVRFGSVHARGMRVAVLAETLGGYTGRVVVDRTGLTEPLDFDLTWTPAFQRRDEAADSSGPSLSTAVEEQLGLKLEPTKAPARILVIDRAERPTED